MRLIRDMALVAAGVGLTLAYQKYHEPVMECMERKMRKMADYAEDKLEDMM